MEPLIDYVTAMSPSGKVDLPVQAARTDFGLLLDVMAAADVNPMNTARALKAIEEENSSERILLATFTALPQGKKFIELAQAFSKEKLINFACLTQIDGVKMDCAAYMEDLEHKEDQETIDVDHMCEELVRLAAELEKASPSVSDSCLENFRDPGKEVVKHVLIDSQIERKVDVDVWEEDIISHLIIWYY